MVVPFPHWLVMRPTLENSICQLTSRLAQHRVRHGHISVNYCSFVPFQEVYVVNPFWTKVICMRSVHFMQSPDSFPAVEENKKIFISTHVILRLCYLIFICSAITLSLKLSVEKHDLSGSGSSFKCRNSTFKWQCYASPAARQHQSECQANRAVSRSHWYLSPAIHGYRIQERESIWLLL